MKLRLSAAILVILALVMTATVSCSIADGEDGGTETDINADETLVLYENGATLYSIVRADEAEDWQIKGAQTFRNAMEALTGCEPDLTTDWEGRGEQTVERGEYEIIIGETNREGSEYDSGRDSMQYRDYHIFTAGKRLVIDAVSETGLNDAIKYFFETYFNYDINGEAPAEKLETMKIPAEIDYRMETELNLFDITDKSDLVAICYSTWFDPIIDANPDNDGDGEPDPPNITEILAGEADWGGLYAFHYWAKPALGYYRSTDKSVIRTHMTQLEQAGIDFIIVDNTNASLGWMENDYWSKMVAQPCTALLDTIVEMRSEGLDTPNVVMWCSSANGWDVVDELYNDYFLNEKYSECWVYWNGKPFFITTTEVNAKNDKVTSRKMWGLINDKAVSEWSFLQKNNTPCYDSSGNAEQMCVCVAMQESYMSLPTATGRRGGVTFWNQWQNAFDIHPKVVTLTWWNEWAAQRFEDNKFVDNYNEEYSRDIEPMEGGHGDEYYVWMCEYIKAYKSGEACPELHE